MSETITKKLVQLLEPIFPADDDGRIKEIYMEYLGHQIETGDLSSVQASYIQSEETLERASDLMTLHGVISSVSREQIRNLAAYFSMKFEDEDISEFCAEAPFECDLCFAKTSPDLGDICIVCGWESDTNVPSDYSPPNHMTLADARLGWLTEASQRRLFWLKFFTIAEGEA